MNFYPIRIKNITKETNSAVCLTLDIPNELHDTFRFLPGQYLTFKHSIDGQELRRSYSICSSVNDPEIQVAIKQVQDGVFSNFANQNLHIGDTLHVSPPQGNFFVDCSAEHNKHYMCICAGSGITPILSIIQSVLKNEANSTVTLIYGNKNSNTVMFKNTLGHIKNRFMTRFHWLNILSREEQDAEVLYGRIDNRKGSDLHAKKLIDIHSADAFYLCGPESMISTVSHGLRSSGIEEANIHYELFFASANDAQTVVEKHHQRAQQYAGQSSDITVKVSGRSLQFELSKDGENLLDAAMNNGADLPFSCKGGVCATCKCKVIQGQADMDLNHALSQEEIDKGFILSCQAHPVSDTLVLDFDQV